MNKNDDHQMSKQALELDMVNIIQGLEEFATFMSFNGNTSGLRILSVQSVEKEMELEQAKQSIDILDLEKHRTKRKLKKQQTIKKSLSFTGIQSH